VTTPAISKEGLPGALITRVERLNEEYTKEEDTSWK